MKKKILTVLFALFCTCFLFACDDNDRNLPVDDDNENWIGYVLAEGEIE